MKENIHKQLYTVLRSQTLSANGKYLFVASSFGDIATFRFVKYISFQKKKKYIDISFVAFSVDKITECIENITNEQISNPIAIFKTSEKIFSLAFHREFLIVGSGTGFVSGYSISSGIIQKKAWSIQLPISPEACDMSEVNDLWLDSENDTLYAACGDSNAYVCSLEDGCFLRKLTGHKDYIHSIHGQ